MKKLIYLPVCLGMLFFSAACENWFDVSPKSDVKAEDLFQQESGFRDVLTGVYSLMSAPESYGRQLSFGYVDVLAQYYNISGNTHRYIKTKDYLYREPYDKEVLSTIWSRQYKGIANLNAMLMFIDEQRGVFSGDEVYRIYKGEILALRGMLHFDMLRLFSASPAIDKERKAIPYLESYTNLPQHQLTVGAVLEKVVKDLNAARELMREVDPYGPNYAKLESLYRNHPLLRNRQKHLNYYAVMGLMARVYMYAENTTEARRCAMVVIDAHKNRNVFPWADKNDVLNEKKEIRDRTFSSEHLFALNIKKLTDYIEGYFMSTSVPLLTRVSPGTLFVAGNDFRSFFFETMNYVGDVPSKLWQMDGVTVDGQLLTPKRDRMPMIRLSEMYYIVAECDKATPATAVARLNEVLASRGYDDSELLDPVSVNSADAVQAEILNEYQREFIAEGQLFFYHKRMKDERLNGYTVNYVFPKPDTETEFGK